VSGREAPFHSAIREHLKGQTQALEDLAIEMLARALSVNPRVADAKRMAPQT
jgi:putative transposase